MKRKIEKNTWSSFSWHNKILFYKKNTWSSPENNGKNYYRTLETPQFSFNFCKPARDISYVLLILHYQKRNFWICIFKRYNLKETLLLISNLQLKLCFIWFVNLLLQYPELKPPSSPSPTKPPSWCCGFAGQNCVCILYGTRNFITDETILFAQLIFSLMKLNGFTDLEEKKEFMAEWFYLH